MLKPKKGEKIKQLLGWDGPCRGIPECEHTNHLQVPTTDRADPDNAGNEVPGTVQLMRHRFLC